MSYSQNNEEEMLLKLLGDQPPGRLLDIGAYVPTTFSNTRALIERGWEAVLVEPSPVPFTALLNEYGNNPKIRLLNAAVVPAPLPMPMLFRDSNGDALSTASADHAARWTSAGVKFREFYTHPISLRNLMIFAGSVQFINIDVEGANWELFLAVLEEERLSLSTICVEHDNHSGDMIAAADARGYVPRLLNGENLIFHTR